MSKVYQIPDVTQTITDVEADVIFIGVQDIIGRSFFLINDGAVSLTYKVYASPSGVVTGDKDSVGNSMSAAAIAKEWEYQSVTGTVAAGASALVDVSSVMLKYIKLSAYTATGSTSLKAYAQKIN
jgi:hypothetical protein